MVGWSDADWAANPDTKCRVASYVFMVAGAAVSWSVKLLPTVCLSSIESEYSSLTRAGKEAIAARSALSDLNQKQDKPTIVFCDNMSPIALTLTAKFHSRTGHIDVAHHFIRHLVLSKQVSVQHVGTNSNLADLLTKGLPKDRHHTLTSQLSLQNYNSETDARISGS